MKKALVAAVAAVIYAVALWVVLTPGIPHIPLFMLVVVTVFVIPPLGGWWLVFMVIRHEKRIFPMVLLAFVPDGFVWYYFERVRSTTQKSRRLA